MPAVSTTRGLVLMILRTPPKPQLASAGRAALLQQSWTKALMQVGRLELAASRPGLRHCMQWQQKKYGQRGHASGNGWQRRNSYMHMRGATHCNSDLLCIEGASLSQGLADGGAPAGSLGG